MQRLVHPTIVTRSPVRTLLTALTVTSVLLLPQRVDATSAGASQDLLIMRSGEGSSAALMAQQGIGQPASRALPLGLLDRGGHTLYTASTGGRDKTLLRAIDVATGAILRSVTLPGVYSTRTGDYQTGAYPLFGQYGQVSPYSQASQTQSGVSRTHFSGKTAGAAGEAPAASGSAAVVASSSMRARPRVGWPADGSQVLNALSFNGRWLALREVNGSTTTHVLVVDTKRMRVATSLTLASQFGLDAISADGALLYLIQSLPEQGFGAYQVRSYQVTHKHLDARIVVAPGETPGSMSGEAWTRAWSPDGSWLYTLYVQSTGHIFIHALHLPARETRCIDFPVQLESAQDMAHFTLSVAPNGRALYAINPVLGQAVAVRNLPAGTVTVADLKKHAGGPQRTQSAATVSSDGTRIYAATGSGIWLIDTRTLHFVTSLIPDQEVASVALSRDGQRLYALSATNQVLDVLDTADNFLANSLPLNHTTWAIEQVAHI